MINFHADWCMYQIILFSNNNREWNTNHKEVCKYSWKWSDISMKSLIIPSNNGNTIMSYLSHFSTSHMKYIPDFSSLIRFFSEQEHPSIVFQSWLNQYWISMNYTTWSWQEVDLSMSSIKNYGRRSSKAFICHQVSRVQLSHWEHSKLNSFVACIFIVCCWGLSSISTKKSFPFHPEHCTITYTHLHWI